MISCHVPAILGFLTNFSLCTLSLSVFFFHCFLVSQLRKTGKLLSSFTLVGIFSSTLVVARLLGFLGWSGLNASTYYFQYEAYCMYTAWLGILVQYFFIVLFFKNLLERPQLESAVSTIQRIFIAFSFAAFISDLFNSNMRFSVFFCAQAYGLFVLLAMLYDMQDTLHTAALPRILIKQGTLFIKSVFKPYFICAVNVLLIILVKDWQESIYVLQGLVLISVPVLLIGIFWFCHTLLKLRFLNRSADIRLASNASYIDLFSHGVQELLKAKSIPQLKNSLIALFKKAFDIPSERIVIHLFASEKEEEMSYEYQFGKDALAPFVLESLRANDVIHSKAPNSLASLLADVKVLIREDLEFTSFYEPDGLECAIHFLDMLEADIFMPLYSRTTLFGYIRFVREARPDRVFTGTEKRLIIAWGAYLDHIVHLIRYVTFEKVVSRQKELIEYAYEQYQQLEHYSESFEHLDKDSRGMRGMLMYKNRRLIGDEKATALLGDEVFKNPIHPIAKLLRQCGQSVERLKMSQQIALADAQGKKLIAYGAYSEHFDGVLFFVGFPDGLEFLSQTFKHTHPLDRPYGLYLQTTKDGSLLNDLLPPQSKTFSLFKVSFLKSALSKKVILLDVPAKDLLPSVEVIHTISMRSQLHVLRMKEHEKEQEVASTLFGFQNKLQDVPLLQKLNDVGTLFIENVHLLELKTQERLAEFISCGFFRPLKSDVKIESNVRLIVSSPHHLQLLAQEGRFSLPLAKMLNAHRLYFPCVAHVPTDELHEAIKDYGYQMLYEKNITQPLNADADVCDSILGLYPVSLQELKSAIYDALFVKKLPKLTVSEDKATYEEVERALRLGKNALKDMRVMAILWKRFGSYAHIATLLGVHRSSVLKRCREYGLVSQGTRNPDAH